jgi:Tfp pilus assembly protein PilN
MQQINLFRHLPQPIKSALDLKMLILLYAAFLMVLMLVSFVSVIGKFVDDSHLNHATKNFTKAQQNLVALAGKYPKSAAEIKLPDMEKLQTCKVQFSKYLTGIANAFISGVWLTEIDIHDHGQTINLKGNSLSEQQVQTYLDQLKKQDVFAGTSLYLQEIQQTPADTKSPSVLSFTLTTKALNVHQ